MSEQAVHQPQLVLINGVPGSGKSTAAQAVAASRPMALALDIDQLKHSMGDWANRLEQSGIQARKVALAAIAQHLDDGYDVVLGQFLAKPYFPADLADCAQAHGAQFTEILLDLPADAIQARLAGRAAAPTRPEHVGNDQFVSPGDAVELVARIDEYAASRPQALRLRPQGSVDQVRQQICALLGWN